MERKRKQQLGLGFFVHRSIMSVTKTVGFISDRMSNIVLRGRWCNIIVLNVQSQSEEKIDVQKIVFMGN
jgi:hypothetical protein